MSDWTEVTAGAGLGAHAEAHRREQIAKSVGLYRDLEAKIEDLSRQLEDLKAEILAEFGEGTEEQEREFGHYKVSVKRQERWTWDSDAVEKMVADGPVPEFVKKTFTVDKRRFLKEADLVREAYLHALTRKPGPATLTITTE